MKRFLFILLVFSSCLAFSQSTKIVDIVSNPGRFNNEFVTIKGMVTQYTPNSAKTTAHYIIQGDFGGKIKINTNAQPPETHKKYEIKGTIVIDQLNREAYVIEQTRSLLVDTSISQNLPPSNPSKDNTYVIIIIGGAILLVLLIGLYFILKKKSEPSSYPSEDLKESGDTSSSKSQDKINSEDLQFTNDDTDFKTIKISTNSSPKTMKFIPGFLEITAGADTGRKFSISGFSTPEGSIVSIGREVVSGEREYAHIQLKEQTVSRKQAEIIANGNILEIKNLSSTNLTQLNGNEIQAGQKMKLEPDAIIKTGEVEFTYRIK